GGGPPGAGQGPIRRTFGRRAPGRIAVNPRDSLQNRARHGLRGTTEGDGPGLIRRTSGRLASGIDWADIRETSGRGKGKGPGEAPGPDELTGSLDVEGESRGLALVARPFVPDRELVVAGVGGRGDLAGALGGRVGREVADGEQGNGRDDLQLRDAARPELNLEGLIRRHGRGGRDRDVRDGVDGHR